MIDSRREKYMSDGRGNFVTKRSLISSPDPRHPMFPGGFSEEYKHDGMHQATDEELAEFSKILSETYLDPNTLIYSAPHIVFDGPILEFSI